MSSIFLKFKLPIWSSNISIWPEMVAFWVLGEISFMTDHNDSRISPSTWPAPGMKLGEKREKHCQTWPPTWKRPMPCRMATWDTHFPPSEAWASSSTGTLCHRWQSASWGRLYWCFSELQIKNSPCLLACKCYKFCLKGIRNICWPFPFLEVNYGPRAEAPMAATGGCTDAGDIKTLYLINRSFTAWCLLQVDFCFWVTGDVKMDIKTPYFFYLLYHGKMWLVAIRLCHKKLAVTEFDIAVCIFSPLMNGGEIAIHDKGLSVSHSEIKLHELPSH